MNGIVEVSPPGQSRVVDRAISSLSREGIYRVADHLAQLSRETGNDLQATADVHVRRLEALRRVGIVERVEEGIWRVPADLLQRARDQDARAAINGRMELRSHLSVGEQLRADGATWLDRQLLAGGDGLASKGFGAEVREGLRSRVDFLVEQGLAERRGQRIDFARNLLSTLRARELVARAAAIQCETGLIHYQLHDGERMGGIYRRSVQLASGRFAMLDDGRSFSLVPWRPVLATRLGQQIAAIVRGSSVNWEFGRSHGPSI